VQSALRGEPPPEAAYSPEAVVAPLRRQEFRRLRWRRSRAGSGVAGSTECGRAP
jgi:hypothetical protein